MKNIYICGFMGSGKTTIARMLSHKLKKRYYDTDSEIEKIKGHAVENIFKEESELEFRRYEEKISKYLFKQKDFVVATGGGFFENQSSAKRALKNGIIVYLNPSFDLCYNRIKNTQRPLVVGSDKNNLKRLYKKREKIYENIADHIIKGEGKAEDIADLIFSKIREEDDFMETNSKMKNVGDKLKGQLKSVGIEDIDALKQIGSKNAWLLIQQIDPSSCLHKLYALEGAILDVSKKDIPPEIKDDIKEFYNRNKKARI